jgi:hypothetical protein
VSDPHTKDEIRLSQERRDKIIDYLLEWLTGDQIDSKTLGHFRFIGTMFGLDAKVRDLAGRTSSVAKSFAFRSPWLLSISPSVTIRFSQQSASSNAGNAGKLPDNSRQLSPVRAMLMVGRVVLSRTSR